MADARVPPLGPPLRDPTAPARLLDAAAELGLHIERAQRGLDGLSNAVEHLALAAAGGPGSPRRWPSLPSAAYQQARYGATSAAPEHASLLADAQAFAIDLAVGGTARSAIREQLGRGFGVADPDAVIAAIVGLPGAGDAPG